MKVKYLVILFFVTTLYSQESEQKKYREDQIYTSLDFATIISSLSGFKQNRLSYSFQFGVVRDIPLNLASNRAIGVGLGYVHGRYFSNLILDTQTNRLFISNESASDSNHSITLQGIELPLVYRWRTSTIDFIPFWRIYTGYKFTYHIRNRYKPFVGKKTKLTNIDPLSHSVFLSIGYSTWNLNFEYSLNSIFKESETSVEGEALSLRPLRIGLIFYLL